MRKILTIIFISISTLLYSQQRIDTIEHKINVESLQYKHNKSNDMFNTNSESFKFTVKPYVNSKINNIFDNTVFYNKSDINNYNYVYLILFDARAKYFLFKK